MPESFNLKVFSYQVAGTGGAHLEGMGDGLVEPILEDALRHVRRVLVLLHLRGPGLRCTQDRERTASVGASSLCPTRLKSRVERLKAKVEFL